MENQSFTVFRFNLSRFISGQLAKPRFLFFHHEFSYSYVHTQPHVIPIERRRRSIGSIRVNMPEVIMPTATRLRGNDTPLQISPLPFHLSSILHRSRLFPFALPIRIRFSSSPLSQTFSPPPLLREAWKAVRVTRPRAFNSV